MNKGVVVAGVDPHWVVAFQKAHNIKTKEDARKIAVLDYHLATALRQKEEWEKSQVVTDRMFIQEVINSIVRHNKGQYPFGTKHGDMLRDLSRELRDKAKIAGKTKKMFYKLVGKQQWMP
jgi:hypothetical protein